ncbi:MAG: serine/threonine protein kinase [Alphaproteobacteria bacterium]|nr:serine/threonine protein kinase [Alphaproteobacteria bacterium]
MDAILTDTGRRRIRLLKALGKGGFGAVFLADVHTPEGLVHRMAVKVLHEEFARDERIAARARDEARLMSQLNHDHVVKVHALTHISGRAAVLMEYIEGIDCTALIDGSRRAGGGGLPATVCAAIIERAASALDAAWSTISPQTGQPLRVVHRDIKPSNLLLSVAGVVKVMDFGVARGDFEREAATESVQYGTHRYMAPERWLYGQAGPESDVYSLGITLWELATGARFERLPLLPAKFEELRDRQLDALQEHPNLDAEAAAALRELLEGMLAFRPEDRLSAQEVEDRAGAIHDALSGPSLRRYARRVVPQLVAVQQQRLENDSSLHQLTNSLAAPGAGGAPVPVEQPPEPSMAVRVGPVLLGMVMVLGVGGAAAWAVLGPEGLAPQEAPAALAEVEPEVPVRQKPGPALKARLVRELSSAPAPRPDPPRPEPPTPRPAPDDHSGTGPPPPAVVKVVEKPPEVPQVSVKITSDPRCRTVLVDGQSHPCYTRVSLPVGVHGFRFLDDGGAEIATCEFEIRDGTTSMKWDGRRTKCI